MFYSLGYCFLCSLPVNSLRFPGQNLWVLLLLYLIIHYVLVLFHDGAKLLFSLETDQFLTKKTFRGATVQPIMENYKLGISLQVNERDMIWLHLIECFILFRGYHDKLHNL